MERPDELDLFYARIKAGLTVADLLGDYERIFLFVHQAGDTPDYREARGRLKRLRDEVTPIVGLLKRQARPEDWIKFNLDSGDHDALWIRDGSHFKIDATVVQARARLNLARELNTRGEGRGFLPLTDDDRTEQFLATMEKDASCYSTDEYISTLDRALRRCLQRKQSTVVDVLVIDAPVSREYIPAERLNLIPIVREPHPLTRRLAVYVVDREVCLRVGV